MKKGCRLEAVCNRQPVYFPTNGGHRPPLNKVIFLYRFSETYTNSRKIIR
jgi:hypothetical protein